ncbi:MAG TPA: GAF and ANTAR domain-containing protein [Nocardioidaceae bacterium]|jgi:GAF domain-containing protein|nr:GAF and ANTAR domain-containing protein [Nocardioidaceae bacterium]
MDASLAEEFGRLAIELHGRRSLDETIDQVVQYALTAVDCDFADVMFLHREKRIETVAATDSLAEKAAQLQAELDEGPVLALPPEPGDHIVVHDTTSDVRWPRWGAELGALGVRSVLSTRLASQHALIGALNLYAHEPLSFDGDDIAIAHILARHASVALATARKEYAVAQSIDARKRVGLAQGMLMERFGLNAEESFELLRRYSQQHRLKLNEVARELVATRELPKRKV